MPVSDGHKHPNTPLASQLSAGLQTDEQGLWERFRGGDHKAFENLLTTHYRMLFQYGSRFSTDPEFIRDNIQDLFLYLWERRAALSSVESVKPYLLVSLRRQMHRKKKVRVAEEPLTSETETDFQVEFSVEDRFIENEAVGQRAERLKKILSALPARQKEVIYLRFFQDLSRDQISEVMTITPQTVSNLLQLAFKELRKSRGIELLLPFLWLFSLV